MKATVLGGVLVAAVAALGVTGAVVAQDGEYCREYQRKVVIGGKVQDSYGTACMQPDGSWQVAGSDADVAAESVADDLQVASMQQVYQTQAVYVERPYYEPVYTDYRYYSAPSFGLNLGWSSHDGRHGGWHGGRGHGGHHGRH